MSASNTQQLFFRNYDGLLCDLDGVVYSGSEAIAGSVDSLNSLGKGSIPVAYVTNNASRAPEVVANHLRRLGVVVRPEQIVGSAAAAVALLQHDCRIRSQTDPSLSDKVLVVGSDYLRQLVNEAGFSTAQGNADAPSVVIQGFSPDLSWKDLAEASYSIRNGAKWIVTNEDLTIPRAEGIAPGNGALIRAVAEATAQTPRLSAGKPEPLMFIEAAKKYGMKNPLVVGDRLDTDILGGNRAGFDTALVLTGISTLDDAQNATEALRPTWVIDNLTKLLSISVEPRDETRSA